MAGETELSPESSCEVLKFVSSLMLKTTPKLSSKKMQQELMEYKSQLFNHGRKLQQDIVSKYDEEKQRYITFAENLVSEYLANIQIVAQREQSRIEEASRNLSQEFTNIANQQATRQTSSQEVTGIKQNLETITNTQQNQKTEKLKAGKT